MSARPNAVVCDPDTMSELAILACLQVNTCKLPPIQPCSLLFLLLLLRGGLFDDSPEGIACMHACIRT